MKRQDTLTRKRGLDLHTHTLHTGARALTHTHTRTTRNTRVYINTQSDARAHVDAERGQPRVSKLPCIIDPTLLVVAKYLIVPPV